MDLSTLPRHVHSASCSGCPKCKPEFRTNTRSAPVVRAATSTPVFRVTTSEAERNAAQHSVTSKPPDGYAMGISVAPSPSPRLEQELIKAMVTKGETDGYNVAIMIRQAKEDA